MAEDEKKIEPYYQAQAKQLVDGLFDKGFFAEDLSRDGMNDVEGLLAFFLQTCAESAARCAVMAKKYKEGRWPQILKNHGEKSREAESLPKQESYV